MSSNPYDAPKSQLDVPNIETVAPQEVLKKIKSAWVAGVISGSITLIFTILAITGENILGFTAWELLDVALVFGLTFGIYKKSRTCAVLMLLYFVTAKILMMVQAGKPTGLLLAVVFTYYFWLGVAGTFEYQKLRRAQESTPTAAA